MNVAAVSRRAEVYWHGPYQQLYPAGFSRLAVMTRLPAPSCAALEVLLV